MAYFLLINGLDIFRIMNCYCEKKSQYSMHILSATLGLDKEYAKILTPMHIGPI